MTRTLLVIDIQGNYFPGGALPLWQAEETEARSPRRSARSAPGEAASSSSSTCRRTARDRSQATRPEPPFAPPSWPRPGTHRSSSSTRRTRSRRTDLHTHLEDTSELVICGMMTQNCVVFTALSDDARRPLGDAGRRRSLRRASENHPHDRAERAALEADGRGVRRSLIPDGGPSAPGAAAGKRGPERTVAGTRLLSMPPSGASVGFEPAGGRDARSG